MVGEKRLHGRGKCCVERAGALSFLRPGIFHFFPVLTIPSIQSTPAPTYATFTHSVIQPAASARARPNCPVAPSNGKKVPPFATSYHTTFFPKPSGSGRPRRRAPRTGNQEVKAKNFTTHRGHISLSSISRFLTSSSR